MYLAQWLSMVMPVHGVQLFCFLHQIIVDKQLDISRELRDEILPETICTTKGYQWLWSQYNYNDKNNHETFQKVYNDN